MTGVILVVFVVLGFGPVGYFSVFHWLTCLGMYQMKGKSKSTLNGGAQGTFMSR